MRFYEEMKLKPVTSVSSSRILSKSKIIYSSGGEGKCEGLVIFVPSMVAVIFIEGTHNWLRCRVR